MTAAALSRDALMPRRPAGMGAGLVLALLAHALLMVALAFSVRWKTSNPAGVEAELWAAVPQIAAPRAVAPEPVPVPPEVKPPPPIPKLEPPPAPAPAPVPDAQIAIEKAKREEAKREQKLREDEKRDLALREEIKREQLRAKEELERKKKEAAKLKQDEDKLEAAREANLKRILGQAGGAAGAAPAGTAAQSAGPSAGYAGRIKARIQPNIVFGDSVSGNPLATVEVRLAPDGTIIGKRLIKSSGVKSWDDAVLRAIDKTEVLPRDTDGRVPPPFEIDFRPHD
jgi:colicin import membrane protein